MTRKGGLRDRKKRETRQAISDVATRLFTQRGFDNVTVAEIAEAANVAKMTVFNYFPRKEDLFFDRDDESRELVRVALSKRTAGESPIRALRRLVDELIAQEHPFVKMTDGVSLFWRTVEQSDALRARARELRDELVSYLAKMIADSVGAFHPDPNAHLAASFAVTAWVVAYTEALARHRQGSTSDAVRSDFLNLIERGFLGLRACLKGTPYE